jgi:hypothetical protein
VVCVDESVVVCAVVDVTVAVVVAVALVVVVVLVVGTTLTGCPFETCRVTVCPGSRRVPPPGI